MIYPCKSRRKIIYFCFAIAWKNPYMLCGIFVTSLLEFVQRRPMYLFIHVWCTVVSANSMLWNPTKKKSAWLVGKRSPCSCVNGLVVWPNHPLVFIPLLSCIHHLWPSTVCLFLCCFCFVLLILWHLSRQQSLPTLCCNGSGHASYYCCF